MMTMLFNSFDLSFYFYPQLFILLFSVLFLSNYFKLSSRNILIGSAMMNLYKFFEELNPKFLPKGSMLLFMSLTLYIFFVNFLSIHPYIFAMTSALSICMPMILTFWVSTMFYMIFFYWKGFVAHTIPQGCPMYLVILLFAIELVSTLIRPITGSMRLMANITAGHLLMILLSKVVISMFPTLLAYIILNGAEMVIAAIQAYIYVTMISLYICDLR